MSRRVKSAPSPPAAAPITVATLAQELGCARQTVTRRAAELEIGTRLGVRLLVFTAAEAAQLREAIHDQPGNPLMGESQPEHYGHGNKRRRAVKKRRRR